MKCSCCIIVLALFDVAPFAGARIEIRILADGTRVVYVAPFAGARIEIPENKGKSSGSGSLPSRERGLKYLQGCREVPEGESLPSRERGLKSPEQQRHRVKE